MTAATDFSGLSPPGRQPVLDVDQALVVGCRAAHDGSPQVVVRPAVDERLGDAAAGDGVVVALQPGRAALAAESRAALRDLSLSVVKEKLLAESPAPQPAVRWDESKGARILTALLPVDPERSPDTFLEEHGLVPGLVVGSSIGSLIGAAWASGVPLRQMEERARAVRRRDIFQVAHTDVAFRRLQAPALYRREPLEFLVRSLVGDVTFRDLHRRLLVNTVDLHSGIQVLWGLPGLLDTKVADAVVASPPIAA